MKDDMFNPVGLDSLANNYKSKHLVKIEGDGKVKGRGKRETETATKARKCGTRA